MSDDPKKQQDTDDSRFAATAEDFEMIDLDDDEPEPAPEEKA